MKFQNVSIISYCVCSLYTLVLNCNSIQCAQIVLEYVQNNTTLAELYET